MGCVQSEKGSSLANVKEVIIYKAIWNDEVIAESDAIINIEDNYYFPPNTIKMEYFESSDLTTECHWKGIANYYNITVNNKTCENGAWHYDNPSDSAKNIKNYIAFYTGWSKPSVKIKMYTRASSS